MAWKPEKMMIFMMMITVVSSLSPQVLKVYAQLETPPTTHSSASHYSCIQKRVPANDVICHEFPLHFQTVANFFGAICPRKIFPILETEKKIV